MTDLQRCMAEQDRCVEYLLTKGACRGARLGLADNFAEELAIRFPGWIPESWQHEQ